MLTWAEPSGLAAGKGDGNALAGHPSFNEGAERLSKNPKQGHSTILTPSRSILRDDLCRPDDAAGTSHMSNTCDRRF